MFIDSEFKQTVQLLIVDIDGKLILEKDNISLIKGRNRVLVSPQVLQTGIYLARIFNVQHSDVKKTAVTR